MNRRNLFRGLLATLATLKIGRSYAEPLQILNPTTGPPTPVEGLPWKRDELRCVYFYKNDKLVGQLGPATVITDKAIAEGWTNAPVEFAAGDIFGIEFRDFEPTDAINTR